MRSHKRLCFYFLTFAAVLLCFLALPQAAHAASIDDLTFTLNNTGDGYIVSNCEESAAGELAIPATYNGLPVTSIGDDAFRYCYSLTSITIPDSVTSIGDDAFYECNSLTSVTIGNGVTSIGSSAFYYCDSLTSITIPDSVTSIGGFAFCSCDSLTSITIPDSVTSIGDRAFFVCSNLISIVVEEGNPVYHSAGNCLIKTSSKTLIAGCKTSQIPTDGSVTSIGDFAFADCSSLTSIVIPNSVTSIGYFAFQSCHSLTDVTYCGTQEQWNSIAIDSDNEPLTNATLQFHEWKDASCTAPKTCIYCAATEGKTLRHNYENDICTTCGRTAPPLGDIDGSDGVTYHDAIYLLLSILFGEDAYPLYGAAADFDGNGTVEHGDAIYLLLHAMFGEEAYPLKG